MNKIVAILLAIAMIFTLCGCGSFKFTSEAQEITDEAIELMNAGGMNLITFGPSEGTWCKINANTKTVEYGLPIAEITYEMWKCLFPLYETDEDMDEEMLDILMTDRALKYLRVEELKELGAQHIIVNVYCPTEEKGDKDWWRYDILTGERA